MGGFHDVRLDIPIAFGVRGGPERRVEVLRLASGREQRNARWSRARRKWDLGGAVVRLEQAADLAQFFEARGGRLNGFRFRDPLDWTSSSLSSSPTATDQPMGIGDGVTAEFQLIKRYTNGGEVWDREINKPVSGSVSVAVDGVETEALQIDFMTGLVSFEAPPAPGAVVTSGFQFDLAVRFDTDALETSLDAVGAVRIGRLPLIEIQG